MTSPETSRRSLDPSVRGVLVLAVVVVVGLLLLAKAAPSSSTTIATRKNPGPTVPAKAEAPTSTTSRPTTAPPTTMGTLHAPAQVKVLVMNGTGGKIPKVAGLSTAKVKAKGFATLEPANATARPTSAVYFAPGYHADAVAVGAVLGIPPDSAVPVPTPPPPAPNASQANVIVLLGQDTKA